MKDENNKTNKIVAILNYFSSICFYIVAIINFIKDNSSMGVIYLCLGSTFLCLGSVNLNKDKEDKEDKEQKK